MKIFETETGGFAVGELPDVEPESTPAELQARIDAANKAVADLPPRRRPQHVSTEFAFDPTQPRDEDGQWRDIDGGLPPVDGETPDTAAPANEALVVEGVQGRVAGLEDTLGAERYAELQKVIWKRGLQIGDEGDMMESEDGRILREAKTAALEAWGEELGMTPEETTEAIFALNSRLETWRLVGGQTDDRVDMQEAMEHLRAGGVAETPLQKGMLLQKAWSDATFDEKYGKKTEVALSRIVSDGHGNLISALAENGEDWTLDAYPLSSWAVQSAAKGIINRWIGREVDSVEMQATFQKEEIWLNVWSEHRFRVKELKASGEFIVDDRRELTSGNITVIDHPGKGGDAYGASVVRGELRKGVIRDALRNGLDGDAALGAAEILARTGNESVVRRHIGIDPDLTLTRPKYGDPPRGADDPVIQTVQAMQDRGLTGGKVATLMDATRGFEVSSQDTLAARLGMVSRFAGASTRSPDEVIARNAEQFNASEANLRAAAAAAGMPDPDAFMADMMDYSPSDLEFGYKMWEG